MREENQRLRAEVAYLKKLQALIRSKISAANGNKLYLSACMDLYNGEIVAHQMARRPVYELFASTLQVVDELEAGVHDYVRYYNHERIKLRLKGLSPVEYRLRNT